MSEDLELELIRKKRLLQLQKKLRSKADTQESIKKPKSPDELLNGAFEGRAWEVWNAAENQYPTVVGRLKEVLVQFISQGKVTSVSGEQLMYLFRRIGMNIRLPTRIKIVESGEMKTLGEKLKESSSK